MGISLSGGPWQYNRFDQFDEAAKPDYLDFDKDGDKKEPMKKALKEKGGKKCPKCGKSPCECGKSDMKEWVEEMVQEGIDLGEYTWDDMKDIYENRRAARAAGGYKDDSPKQTDPSKDGFTGISGSIKEIMRQNKEIEARNKAKTKKEEVKGMHREADTGKVVDKAEVGKTYYPNMPKKKTSVALRKEKGMKEEVCHYLMSEGFANNPVSAEIMFNHMSEEWLEAIEEGYKSADKDKIDRQIGKAYDKEQAAAKAGDEKETNRQMQRRIAMSSPSTRKTQLQNKKN